MLYVVHIDALSSLLSLLRPSNVGVAFQGGQFPGAPSATFNSRGKLTLRRVPGCAGVTRRKKAKSPAAEGWAFAGLGAGCRNRYLSNFNDLRTTLSKLWPIALRPRA